jgi:hypothetical protein
MFVGEGTRLNNLEWIFTLNGPSLSEDMVQRCCIVKIDRPKHQGGWDEDTFRFIDANRQALIADCLGFFEKPGVALGKFSRWSTWERDVLARLPEPTDTQRVILERQGEVNVEAEELEIIENFIERRLTTLNYNTATEVIHIPVEIVAEWFNSATNEKHRTQAESRQLNQAAKEAAAKGKTYRLKQGPSRTHGRGFLWIGKEGTPSATTCNDLEQRIKTSGCGSMRM